MEMKNIERVMVHECGQSMRLPAWAATFIALGWRLASTPSIDSRVFVICLVANRMHVASLVSLGAVLSSAKDSKGKLSWEDLESLPSGTKIFWRDLAGQTYEGFLVASDSEDQIEFVKAKVVKSSNKRAINAICSFSKERCTEYIFSDVKLPSQNQSSKNLQLNTFLKDFEIEPGPAWLDIARPDVVVTGSGKDFVDSCQVIDISLTGKDPIILTDILLPGNDHGGRGHRVRTKSVGFTDSYDCRLQILDGAKAFRRFRELGRGHVIALMEYAEFSEQIRSEVASFHQEKIADRPDFSYVSNGIEQMAMSMDI